MENKNWRYILSDPASGAWNMALDEAISESVTAKLQPLTVRFYAWEPACLSLGHAQATSDVDLPSLEHCGWQIVRRPTGGRAILHTDEITYSICARQEDPLMEGGVLESYRRISGILIAGLAKLGINAVSDNRYELPEGSIQDASVCFEVPSNFEITVDGAKLVGSAQSRRNLGVLQHGSLPLRGDLSRIIDVLRYDDVELRSLARQRLLSHAVTVENILGYPIDWHQAAGVFLEAFSEYFKNQGDRSIPSELEIRRADELVAEKYGNPAWTFRR